MLLREAKELLKKNGYRVRLDEDCGGFAGRAKRPEKPSPDAEWVEGCYGGHWYVPSEQDKRRNAYYAKKDKSMSKALRGNKKEIARLSDEAHHVHDEWISEIKSKCEEVMNNYLPKALKSKFDESGWKISDYQIEQGHQKYIAYSFTASKDDYRWKVTSDRFLEKSSFGNAWSIDYESPSGQRIPRDQKKNSSYYTGIIKKIVGEVNAGLEQKIKKIENIDTDVDLSVWHDQIKTLEDDNRRQEDEYDELNGWDSKNDDFKVNLTPKGNLKKKIVRHESMEIDRANSLLESAEYFLEQ